MGRSKTSPPSVTLEVGIRTAKIIVATPWPFTIQRVNASTLPEHSDDPVSALRALLAAQPPGVRQAGLLFGRETFSLRTLELPSSDPKEIASMLDLQLGKLTPYPRSEILSAWSLIGSFREGYTSVLLAIARKTLIESVLQFLKTKGIAPQWVGVSTEGLEAWWASPARMRSTVPEGQLLALIDVDATSTDCAILSASGQLLFTHSIATGYEQLTASEDAKLRWVGELVRLPRILLHEDVKGHIGRGIITGVWQGLESLVEQLTSQWGVEIEVTDALQPFNPSPAVSKSVASTRVSYTALAGIVSSGRSPRIDLIPPEARVSQELRVRSRHLARLAGSLGAALILAVVLCAERVLILRYYLAQLHRQLAVVEPLSRQVLERQQAMHAVRRWLDPSRSALEVFRGVSAAMMEDITITQVAMEEGKPVTIRGKAGTMAGAFAFADRLKQQGTFATVDTRPVLKPRSDKELGAEFEMVCEFATS